jgi:hypothetical protein
VSGFTPGPWYWDGTSLDSKHCGPPNYGTVIDAEVQCGMYCLGGSPVLNITDADRALIAAAPTMYAALQRMVDNPGLWCKGAEALGTACGECSRCIARAALSAARPAPTEGEK